MKIFKISADIFPGKAGNQRLKLNLVRSSDANVNYFVWICKMKCSLPKIVKTNGAFSQLWV